MGGKNGITGRNIVLRKNGSFEELASRVQLKVYPCETIIVQTPSGGGYGEPNNG